MSRFVYIGLFFRSVFEGVWCLFGMCSWHVLSGLFEPIIKSIMHIHTTFVSFIRHFSYMLVSFLSSFLDVYNVCLGCARGTYCLGLKEHTEGLSVLRDDTTHTHYILCRSLL